MKGALLVVATIAIPVFAISWLCCIVYCIYKGLIKGLAKEGRTTRVQVRHCSSLERKIPKTKVFQIMVTDRRGSGDSGPLTRRQSTATTLGSSIHVLPRGPTMPGAMPEVHEDQDRALYGPVVHVPEGLKRSLELQGKSLSDSLGPVYYPKHPLNQSDHVDGATDSPRRQSMSPMRPLQPPWPHLPPLNGSNDRKKQRVPNSVCHFLENQR